MRCCPDCCQAVPHARYELFFMRLFFALVVFDVYAAYPSQVGSLGGQPEPVGLARFLDLTFLGNGPMLEGMRWLLLAALAIYISGRFLWLALPVMSLLIILPGTLALSQGAATHHRQLVALVLLVQAIYAIGHALRARKSGVQGVAEPLTMQRNLAHYTKQTMVATYLVTAITKMIHSGGSWFRDAKYFPLQLEKTRMSEFYNKLEERGAGAEQGGGGVFGAVDGWFAGLSVKIEEVFLASPDTCRFFIGSGLVLEFLAPLAMLGRRWGTVMGLVLVAFHLTISRVMNLTFEHIMWMLVIYFVNVPFLIVSGVHRLRERKG